MSDSPAFTKRPPATYLVELSLIAFDLTRCFPDLSLGQGGCMAIEDAYVLGRELDRMPREGEAAGSGRGISLALKRCISPCTLP